MQPEKNLQILSGFVLKLIAFLTMTLDHVGLFLMNPHPEGSWVFQMAYVFRVIGRIALPLFLMLSAVGVRFSHRPWRYFFRLLIMHLAISLVLTIIIYGIPSLGVRPQDITGNAFCDLTLLVLALLCLRMPKAKKLLAALPIGICVLAYVVTLYEHANHVTITWFPAYLRPDYSLFGMLVGLGFYYAYPIAEKAGSRYAESIGMSKDIYLESPAYRKLVNLIGCIFFFVILVIFWGISYISYNYNYRPLDNFKMQLQSYCLLAIPLLYLYSGKRGYDSKAARWIFYLYYPVHLAILFLIFSL